MTEPISLAEARADKANDARLWSPLECLKAIVRDLENGELRQVNAVYVAMYRKEEGKASTYPFYSAGAGPLEVKGMLAQHLHDCCDLVVK